MKTGIKNVDELLRKLGQNGYELDGITHTGENSFDATVSYKKKPACNISIRPGGNSYIEDVEETLLNTKRLIELSDLISPYTISKRDQLNT